MNRVFVQPFNYKFYNNCVNTNTVISKHRIDYEKEATPREVRHFLKASFDKILITSARKWKNGLDQDMLKKIIWPQVSSTFSDVIISEKTSLVVHDSYTCIHFKDKQPPGAHRPFPTRRNEDTNEISFVGQRIGKNAEQSISLEQHGTCPMLCRPREHPDWILC